MSANERFGRRVFRDPAYFVAAGFGSGLAPKAPGTAGTVVGVILYALLLASLPLWVYIAVVAGALLLGVVVSQRVTRQLGVEDHQGIVWDEVVGVWVTLAFAHPVTNWVWLAAAFLLFRVFDILKPWPIRTLDQRVKGGLGVMLDDVLAGVYAGVLLLIALTVSSKFI